MPHAMNPHVGLAPGAPPHCLLLRRSKLMYKLATQPVASLRTEPTRDGGLPLALDNALNREQSIAGSAERAACRCFAVELEEAS